MTIDLRIKQLLPPLQLPEQLKAPLKGNEPLLKDWQANANLNLRSLQELIQSTRDLPPELVALICANVVPLRSSVLWTNDELSDQAENTVHSLVITRETFRLILSQHVKPFFIPSPHPMLDLNTGRKLPRPAGGAMAMQDYYTTQVWKAQLGLATLLKWVISQFQPEDYESLWPLLIPPIMTYLDDYQAQYKLEGVKLVKEMLRTVPAVLLNRSGVGELLYTSLTRTLATLHDPHTPALIRISVPTTVTLITLLTAPNSGSRFDKLSHLLGEGIIGGVWVYASRDLDTIEASMEACEIVIKELAIGSVRYLKALIPQLTHCLVQHDFEIEAKPVSLQMAALKALTTTIRACQPRIQRWKGRIIESVAKAWVVVRDNESRFSTKENNELEASIKRLFTVLAECCPSVNAEYDQLQQRYPELFGLVLSGLPDRGGQTS